MFPHNPTGLSAHRAMNWTRLSQLLGNAAPTFSATRCNRLLEYDPARRLPPMGDLYEKGISLSGLSKTCALPRPAPRLVSRSQGSACGQPMAWLERLYTTICNSAPSEILGVIALRAKETIVARNLAIILENLRSCWRVFLRRIATAFAWIEPQARSVAFPQWVGGGLRRTILSGCGRSTRR